MKRKSDLSPNSTTERTFSALRTFFLEVSAARKMGAGEVPPPETDFDPKAPISGPPILGEPISIPTPSDSTPASASSRPCFNLAHAATAEGAASAHATDSAATVLKQSLVEEALRSGSKSASDVKSGSDGKRRIDAVARIAPAREQITAPGRSPQRAKSLPKAPRTAILPRAKTSRKPRRRSIPSWALSLLTHLTLLIVLSCISLANLDESDDFCLIATSAPIEDLPTFQEIDVEFVNPSEDLVDQPIKDLVDPADAAIGKLAPSEPFMNRASDAPPGSPALGDVASLFQTGQGGTGRGAGLGGEATASFFGTRLTGRRILFLLDNSGSMQGGRLETVLTELEKSVAALKPQQLFYVVFYSDDVYPLFFPEPATGFVTPSDSVREALHQWLDRVELCYGDVIDEALKAAFEIEPDTVFLLSDGKIMSPRDFDFLLASGKPFPIHTFGVGLGAGMSAREKLRQIAVANKGEFREAEVPDAMRALAQEQPRTYHRQRGAVWGRRVNPR